MRELNVSRQICEYIVRLCEELRKNREMPASLSNRASISLSRMSQAVAFLKGNPAVYPEDVKRAFIPSSLTVSIPREESSRPGTDRSRGETSSSFCRMF